jgi:hypothetical protein
MNSLLRRALNHDPPNEPLVPSFSNLFIGGINRNGLDQEACFENVKKIDF